MEQSILRALAYFDLADYPLTKEELFSFLWQPPIIDYDEFCEFLSLRGGSEASDEVPTASRDPRFAIGTIPRDRHAPAGLAMTGTKFGYYFLSGREQIVELRRQRLLVSELKMKIARRAAKKIRAAPFLKAIFVCNSVGTEQAKTEGDIDFFIVAAPGRIWLVRFFTNLILRLWGLRTYGPKTNNRICLSFYVDSANLDLSGLRAVEDDVHFIYWLHQMVPLYDPQNYYAKFLSANIWTEKYLPNFKPNARAKYILPVIQSKIGRLWQGLWERMWTSGYGNLLENQVKQIQLLKLKPSLKAKAREPDNGVVIKEGVLKFHENDRRLEYYRAWKEKLKILNIERCHSESPKG